MIAWSWSRLDTFEACPLQFYHKNVIKSVPFEQTDTMIRGERIHKHIENALKGAPIDSEVRHMAQIIDRLNSINWDERIIESENAYTESMKKVSWFARNAWVRIKQDFLAKKGVRAVAIDWKTGKNRGFSDQLKLYAAEAMYLWPDVEVIETSYVFVDSKQRESKTFTRDDYQHIWDDFGDRAERIQIAEENGNWPAKPSAMACRFCPVKECTSRK
jgi:CRISPR/Cas system-associated exonuclease Cas4 (RecB family)